MVPMVRPGGTEIQRCSDSIGRSGDRGRQLLLILWREKSLLFMPSFSQLSD